MTVQAIEREFPFSHEQFEKLRRLAREHTGIAFGEEKYDLFYARLARRLRRLGLSDFGQYLERVSGPAGADELAAMCDALTTNLTSFFREAHHFGLLCDHLQADLPRRSKPLRIWSAGCSSGEEPYSIAMSLAECLPDGTPFEVLATDIDRQVLARAAAGIFSAEAVQGIEPGRLKRWFLREKGGNRVRIKPELQQHLQFGQLNLLSDWRMGQVFDAIFCRNVMIYFDKPDKMRLVDRFADQLQPGGVLFLGHSESLLGVSSRFCGIGRTGYQLLQEAP